VGLRPFFLPTIVSIGQKGPLCKGSTPFPWVSMARSSPVGQWLIAYLISHYSTSKKIQRQIPESGNKSLLHI
jgi:hypothetical protein